MVLALAALCWLARLEPPNTPAFPVVSALVLAVTVVVIPTAGPYNHFLLLPAVLLVARNWTKLWQDSFLLRAACALAGSIFCWPWLAALALTFASLILPPPVVQRAWAVPLWTILFVPFSVILLLGWLAARTSRSLIADPSASTISRRR
jgi:hypothetical protein